MSATDWPWTQVVRGPMLSLALGPCWDWTGCRLGSMGYGRVTRTATSRLAHRVVYERVCGPVAAGLELDHLCARPECVNPGHLEPVTPRENKRRSMCPTAVNARKTHCPRGHVYDAANTYHAPEGKRVCRICRRANDARRRVRA